MHTKSVDRANPGCILFLVDHSQSMTEGLAGSSKPKADAVASAINRFLGELIITCERGGDRPRNYFDVGVIAYTTDADAQPLVGPVLGKDLAGKDLVSMEELFENPLDLELRQQDSPSGTQMDVYVPIWYRAPSPETMAGTPMCAVLEYAYNTAADWCGRHPRSFPPLVIHLTDGDATDGDPEPAAAHLQSLATQDGNLLLFNCHLSDSQESSVLFPALVEQLADGHSQRLFRMSSVLPERLRQMAVARAIDVPPGARGMAFNADATCMLQLINVGTTVATSSNLR